MAFDYNSLAPRLSNVRKGYLRIHSKSANCGRANDHTDIPIVQGFRVGTEFLATGGDKKQEAEAL